MNKLPKDLIYNHIVPFTYQLQDKNHLLDIRSFVSDYNILEHFYFCNYSSIILLNDLQIFIYDSNKYIFSRFKKMKNKTKLQVCKYEILFFNNKTDNTDRKVKLLWGILTPFERTCFINKFIIDKFDI